MTTWSDAWEDGGVPIDTDNKQFVLGEAEHKLREQIHGLIDARVCTIVSWPEYG